VSWSSSSRTDAQAPSQGGTKAGGHLRAKGHDEASPVVVVGGGVTGLGAAWTLHRAGVPVVVLEAGEEVGGAVRSERTPEGLVLELGPQTLSIRGGELAEVLEMLEDAGAGSLVEASTAGARRYVVHRGALVPLPHGPRSFLASPLLSAGAKVRLLGEPFRRGAPPDRAEESVASFVRRRFGPEVLERLVDPFVSGVWAGDPEALMMGEILPKLVAFEREHGSVARGVLGLRRRGGRGGGVDPPAGRILSYAEGLQVWPRAVAALVAAGGRDEAGREVCGEVHTGAPVFRVQRRGDAWEVEWGGAAPGELRARGVVLALPPAVLGRLLESLDPEAARALAGIPVAPVAVVHLAWPRDQLAHPLDGFGMLAPSAEQRRILGSLWPTSVFSGQGPAELALTVNFVGGARFPERVALPDDALVELVRVELADLLGARGAPTLTRVTRWTGGIPQYVRGHAARVRAAEAAEGRLPGLALAGNWRSGVSLGAAWASGVAAAKRVGARR
jgi:protoporphyrinogen/coproporphyrinogen III oxidase